jgi:hypothetical protein
MSDSNDVRKLPGKSLRQAPYPHPVHPPSTSPPEKTRSLRGALKIIAAALFCTLPSPADELRPNGLVDFNLPDRPLKPEDFRNFFGNFHSADAFADIVDRSLRVRFPKGRKIEGLQGATVRIPPASVCTLGFRVRYPKDFSSGLHGKEFGMGGGAAYTGGRGREARERGDGWSIRLQFDAGTYQVRNQLYIYHAGMKGQYGEPHGSDKTPLRLDRDRWHRITLRVTMQSAPGLADGNAEVWHDGKRVIHLENLQLVTKEAGRRIDRLLLEAFCGGAGKTPEKDEFVFFDDIRWDSGPQQ